MKNNLTFNEWCDNIHHGGLSKCTFCCQKINYRLKHYQSCDVAKRFFKEIYSVSLENTESHLQIRNLFETDEIDTINQSPYINDPDITKPDDWNSDEEEDGTWVYDEKIKNPFNVNNINLCIAAAIQGVVLHPVKLEIVRHPNCHSDAVEFDSNDLSKQDELWCKNHSHMDSVIFPDINKIVAISDKTGNIDNHGGCGYCGFVVDDFLWTENFTNGVRLGDLAKIVYRLKGSKYDWNYELYDHTNFIIIGETLYLNVVFCYGS